MNYWKFLSGKTYQRVSTHSKSFFSIRDLWKADIVQWRSRGKVILFDDVRICPEMSGFGALRFHTLEAKPRWRNENADFGRVSKTTTDMQADANR